LYIVVMSTTGAGQRWRNRRFSGTKPRLIGSTFEPGVAVPLFDTNVTGFFPYDVSPDGRFLLNTISEAAALTASPVTIVLNWQAGLRR
jgi:hypothetical protein